MTPLWAPLDALMAVSALLLSLRLVLLLVCAAWDVLRRWRRPPSPVEGGRWPSLAVLIPAYNEERVLAGVLESVLRADYPDLRVIVVDDGSTDATLALARGFARRDARVLALAHQANQGKAAALNTALAHLHSEVVVSVDADTVLAPDTLRHLVAPLVRQEAAAVCCNLKVGNRTSWLLHWQSIEYVLGLNLGRRAQATLGCITTIPGAAAAFRREVLSQVGGWSADTRTEDTDLTLDLLERGHRVVYEPRAHAFTEAPDTLSGLLRQRTRWMHGYLACLWKHRRSFLRLDMLGLFGMPNLLLLHLLAFPLFIISLPYLVRVAAWSSPLAVVGLLFSLLWLDMLIALMAYLVDGEQLGELLHAPFWRLSWPFFLLGVFLHTWRHILAGRHVPWNKLKRTGELADRAREGGSGSLG